MDAATYYTSICIIITEWELCMYVAILYFYCLCTSSALQVCVSYNERMSFLNAKWNVS